MAKTRMLVADREAIALAIIAHKFDPIQAALKAEEAKLAQEARERLYDKKTLAWIAAAPEGALPTNAYVYLRICGQYHTLEHSEAKRLFDRDDNRSGSLNLGADDEFGERVIANRSAQRDAQRQRDDLYRTTLRTIEKFRTFDDLHDTWADARAFVEKRWKSRPEFKVTVPAVALADLSAKLDLPPELAEAA